MEAIFLTELEKEYSELMETGKIKMIEDVKRLTSKQFSYSTPLYYLGNIRSKIALITFNSKKDYLNKRNKPTDFNSYQDSNQNLGEVFLETKNEEEFEAAFSSDIRLLTYFKPFQVIRLDGGSLQQKLQKFTNDKLELGLVPYLSPDFTEKDFINNYSVCKPFIERVLCGILAYSRQYIVFIGDGFKDILSEYTEESETFRFLLTSSQSPNQKFIAQFTRITLNYENRKIIAGIAESFNDKNLDEIMLEKYGRESVAIINRGYLLSNPLWKSQ